MTNRSKFSAGAAMLASLSLAATPAAATDLTVIGQGNAYAEAMEASEGDAFERHRRWRHRNRVRAGDVIAGIAIIGGIAAIASAANKNKRKRYDDRRYDDRQYRNDNPRQYQTSSLDQAVNACTSEIARDVRVDAVDSVSRVGEGWQVSGRLYNGNGFTCSVSSNGRIDRIDYSGNFSGASADSEGAYQADAATTEDNQWSDERYAEARQQQAEAPAPQTVQAETAAEGQPAYPGGPLPGEEIDGDLGG